MVDQIAMDPDYQRPSTWVRFKPSLCDGCAAGCCRLPVEVDTKDLIRLELLTEDEGTSVDNVRKAAKRLANHGYIQQFRARTGVFILAQTSDDRCLFLGKDGRCTVYEKRPDTCRRFPVEIGPRVGFCPATKS